MLLVKDFNNGAEEIRIEAYPFSVVSYVILNHDVEYAVFVKVSKRGFPA